MITGGAPRSEMRLGARLAHGVVRQRRWIAAAWVLVAALLLPHARQAAARLEVAARVPGSESDAVTRLLADRFDSPFARSAVLVVTGAPPPNTAAGRAALRPLVDAVTKVDGVTRTLSYLDVADSAFLGAGTGTFVVVGLDARNASGDVLVSRLRAGTAGATAALRATYPAAEVTWTGEDALNHDLRASSARDVSSAERRALPLTLVLLVLAFGAVAAAVIPLGVAGLAIALALGGAALIARVWPLSIALQNVVSMLGLGLGVDYTLLLVSRFREARAAGRRSGSRGGRGGDARGTRRARLGGSGRDRLRRAARRAARRPPLDRRRRAARGDDLRAARRHSGAWSARVAGSAHRDRARAPARAECGAAAVAALGGGRRATSGACRDRGRNSTGAAGGADDSASSRSFRAATGCRVRPRRRVARERCARWGAVAWCRRCAW